MHARLNRGKRLLGLFLDRDAITCIDVLSKGNGRSTSIRELSVAKTSPARIQSLSLASWMNLESLLRPR